MDEQTFLQLVADILETDVADVDLTGDLDTLGWDSLSNISFIAEIDERVGVTIDPDALAEATTVADLRALASGA
jgi:acyl carrier protein